MVETNSTPPRPQSSLIDTAIVLLISVGLTIFVFWLGSTFAGGSVFSQLPEFITDPFKAFWSVAATSGTGLGIAIVRAVTGSGRPKPNYLIQVLVACALISTVVLLIAYLARPSGVVFTIPNDVVFVDPTKNTNSPEDFTLGPNPGMGTLTSYSLSGTYELKDGNLLVHMKGGKFTFSNGYHPKEPLALTHISMALCHVIKTQIGENWDSFPMPSPIKGGVDVSIPLSSPESVTIPPLEFKIGQIPSDLPKKKTWLCAQIWNDAGGYWPAE